MPIEKTEIELVLSDDTILQLALIAHDRDITLNFLMTEIFEKYIDTNANE